jgi:hypothetical protein
MNILLTPEKIAEFDACAVAEWNSWPPEKKRQRPFREYRDAVLCRAQLRKVTDWLENNPETDIDAGTLLALKAAGGAQ